MESAQKLFVFSERRYGKTSLVRAALGKLPRKGYLCAYVDLWPTDSEATFATAVAKGMGQGHIHEVCELTQGHPFYTQHLCHVLWELCEPKAQVNADMLRAAVKLLLDRESYAYTALWESLTLSQKRLLKGLAAEAARVKVFAGEFVSRHGLGSPSNAQRAVQALLAKDIIDRDNGSFLITDRFFRLWIQSARSV